MSKRLYQISVCSLTFFVEQTEPNILRRVSRKMGIGSFPKYIVRWETMMGASA